LGDAACTEPISAGATKRGQSPFLKKGPKPKIINPPQKSPEKTQKPKPQKKKKKNTTKKYIKKKKN
jgi:hypothetical protein